MPAKKNASQSKKQTPTPAIQSKKPDLRWISYDTANKPFITVDVQKRLYFNGGARELIGGTSDRVSSPLSVQVSYDFANKRIVVGKSGVLRAANVKPHTLDKRGYVSARPFLATVGLKDADLPVRYTYIGRDFTEYPDGAHIFGMDGDAGEDGKL